MNKRLPIQNNNVQYFKQIWANHLLGREDKIKNRWIYYHFHAYDSYKVKWVMVQFGCPAVSELNQRIILYDDTIEITVTIQRMQNKYLTEKIREIAKNAGVDALGFADASPFSDYAWQRSKRRAPNLSLQEAKSIIVAGIYIGGLKLPGWKNPWYGRTSRLYLSGYFLDAVEPMQPIAALLKDAGYQALVCDGVSDESSILPLKLAAVRAGIGWQGKHSVLISKKFGTFLALGGIITDAEIALNTPEERNRCRECDQCQQACSVGALEKPYVLNMKKCISYRLQIDDLPDRVKAVMQNRVADCEICQDACPWNAKHIKRPLQTRLTRSFQNDIEAWESFFHLPELINLSEQEYLERLGHLKTGIPYAFFHRNVKIALDHIKKGEEIDS